MNEQGIDAVFEDLELFSLADRITRNYGLFYDKVVLSDVLQEYGVTRRGLRVLQAMYSEDGSLDKASLSAVVGLDAGSLQRTLIDLIGRGMVSTTVTADTAILNIVTLTDKGREACRFARDRIAMVLHDDGIRDSLTLSESERVELVRQLVSLEARVTSLNTALETASLDLNQTKP